METEKHSNTRRTLSPIRLGKYPAREAKDGEAPSDHQASEKPQLAIFSVHGMGQQIQFQTLDSVANGLLSVCPDGANTEIKSRTVLIDEQRFQRVEFEMKDAVGRDVDVHVYEAYWAPITEGAVSLKDTLTFLYSGAFNGFKNALNEFTRVIFGRAVKFKRTGTPLVNLGLAVGVVTSILLINVLTAIIWSSKAITASGSDTSWPSKNLLTKLTDLVTVELMASGILGLVFVLLHFTRPRRKPPHRSGYWQVLTLLQLILVHLWYLVSMVVGAGIVIFVALDAIKPGIINDETWFANGGSLKHLVVVWGIFLVVSWKLKNVLIQYMGDVAAYVSSHKLDRFQRIRTDIKAKSVGLLEALYAARNEAGDPLYEQVGVIAHSLGSVVAYDALNTVLLDDELADRQHTVAERSSVLVTFGSPLDKTAYIFGMLGHKTSETRESLALTRQPLVEDYPKFRSRLKWINVYSNRDVISGALHFYDDVDSPHYEAMKVDNVKDKDALIPLVSHTEYWKYNTVWASLYNHLKP